MATTLTARNATAADLVAILDEQKAHKLDIVAPSTNMKFVNGNLVVKESEAQLTDSGVLAVNGTYRPTDVFDEGLAEKLGIPRRFLARLRSERPDLYDSVANGLLHGRKRRLSDGSTEQVYPADERAFLLRLFRGEDGGEGVARAVASDRFSVSMDNLDMLTAVLNGIRDSGVNVISRVSDLSERRMRVRFEAPDVNVEAPGLLAGYRSPFGDGQGQARRAGHFDDLRQRYGAHHIFRESERPLAFAGFDFGNSETGGGAYTLTPVVEMVACTNGWVIRKEGIRKVHLGTQMEAGLVRPSVDTLRKAGELVAAQTRDAVQQWLREDYLRQLVAGLEQKAAVPVASPAETVPAVVAGLGFSEEEQRGVLDMFILGGQATAGGLAQAVSAFAQTVEDVDRAYEVELAAVEAMERAAKQ